MKSGLYVVNFKSNAGAFGGGTAFIEDGRIHGGDLGYIYSGKYQTNGNSLSAQLTIKRHNPAAQSIFGNVTEFPLTLKGSFTDGGFNVDGSVTGQPATKIQIGARKVADALI